MQIGKSASQFNVLDIAGTGRCMVPTYSAISAKSPRTFFLKSIDTRNEDISLRRGSCGIIWMKALLQDQLKKEPSNHYDHVHMHSLLGKFTGAEIDEAFRNINRIMKKDGYLFFSADDFKVAVDDNKHEFAILLAADRIRNDYSICLSHFYTMYSAEEGPKWLRRILGGDFALPKMEEIMRFFGANSLIDLPLERSVRDFFSLFTENLASTQYYAIAQKKE